LARPDAVIFYDAPVTGEHKVALSPGDWSVLGLLAEQPAHGFALARLVGRGGELGRIWELPRPLVYRSLQKLEGLGLAAVVGDQVSELGPSRTVMAVTPEGRSAVERWLIEPVSHVRDIRSLFLLKLALLDRSGGAAGPLLAAQRALLEPQIEALRSARSSSTGFDAILAAWRFEASEAVLRFIDAAEAVTAIEQAERRPRPVRSRHRS